MCKYWMALSQAKNIQDRYEETEKDRELTGFRTCRYSFMLLLLALIPTSRIPLKSTN